MKPVTRARMAMLGLQWALGLVVLVESLLLALSPGAARAFHKSGMPDFVRLGIAWGEALGAGLFLIPPTEIAGGWTLLGVFLAAIAIHLLHGIPDVGYLVIYAAAAWAVVEYKKDARG